MPAAASLTATEHLTDVLQDSEILALPALDAGRLLGADIFIDNLQHWRTERELRNVYRANEGY